MARETKYARVVERLREGILARPSAGAKLPSTMQLHRELGVSPATINRAMQQLAEEGAVVRIEGSGTFVSDRKRNARQIVFELPRGGARAWWHDPYPTAILQASEDEAHKHGKQMVIRTASGPTEPRNASEIAGTLVLFNYQRSMVEAYHKLGIPVVLIEPLRWTTGTPFVTADHFAIGRECALYLAGLGHRRIVYATVDFSSYIVAPIDLRAMGFREAMDEMGLTESCHVHRIPAKDVDTFEYGAFSTETNPAIREFLTMLEDFQPTACSCFDDPMAAAVLRVCHETGIRVPDELSVTGVNDGRLAMQVWPTLTSVHLPAEEMGRSALRLLNTLIEDGCPTAPSQTFPVKMVERNSTKRLSSPESAGAPSMIGAFPGAG